jgi:hypothetical protein
MTYKIVEGTIKSGKKLVPVFQVRDERGLVFCNESTRALALAHIEHLKEADERHKQAEEDERRRDRLSYQRDVRNDL